MPTLVTDAQLRDISRVAIRSPLPKSFASAFPPARPGFQSQRTAARVAAGNSRLAASPAPKGSAPTFAIRFGKAFGARSPGLERLPGAGRARVETEVAHVPAR